jgi:hypothetical protein
MINVEFSTNQVYRTSRKIGTHPPITALPRRQSAARASRGGGCRQPFLPFSHAILPPQLLARTTEPRAAVARTSRFLHSRPKPLIDFAMLPTLFSAFPCAKPSPGALVSVNSGDFTAAHNCEPCHRLHSAVANPPCHRRIRIQRSRSNPTWDNRVSPGAFAKETLQFSKIKPQSTLVQKYLQNSPFFSSFVPAILSFLFF